MASTRKSNLWPLIPSFWPILLLFHSFALHVSPPCIRLFFCLNILVAVVLWWSVSSSVSSLNVWHVLYNSKDTNNMCPSFTCIQSLCQKPFTVKWHVIYLWLAASKLSSLFLFSYPCYHIRYSFVPCKYIHVVITPPSSSFIHSSPSKIVFVVVKCYHTTRNAYALCSLFHA